MLSNNYYKGCNTEPLSSNCLSKPSIYPSRLSYGVAIMSSSSISPAYLSRTHAQHLAKNALLVSAVASMMGLTACSSSQVSKPMTETSSSTVTQDATASNQNITSPVIVVETPAQSEMIAPSSFYTKSANTRMINAAPQLSVRPLSGIIVQPKDRDN